MDLESQVKVNGRVYPEYVVAEMMDDDIREYLHFKMAPCNPQLFVEAYLEMHFEKYGEPFVIN